LSARRDFSTKISTGKNKSHNTALYRRSETKIMPMQNNSTTKKVYPATLNNLEKKLFDLFDRQSEKASPRKSVLQSILAYSAALDVVQTQMLGKVSLINN
jgi:hypothetical protein